MAVITLTEENFNQTIEENALVLVDFWAQWCGPCRAFSDVYLSVSHTYPNIVFAKVDIEKQLKLAEAFKVQTIPMLVIFKAGVVVYAEAGALTEFALKEVIEKAQALDNQEIQKQITAQ